ncbi:uncharacterized protein B0H18DRAFT_1127802 [Fomitopsis serialis]|uniref:uncharacterized protein n=1 Tax=Fomitopsis serialis TaxID=139415 RepID=UPI00200843E1|nr:uncharacterized protein B0H18DRAFT_1127802 [Neoantrodia serialis]KAH9911977.1 hypothetical protein B0H18DRAFT_1127802 [Neoantrodia serialis]
MSGQRAEKHHLVLDASERPGPGSGTHYQGTTDAYRYYDRRAQIPPSVAHQYDERMPGLTSPSNQADAYGPSKHAPQARTGAYGYGRCVRVRPSVAHQYDEHMPGLTSPSKHAPIRPTGTDTTIRRTPIRRAHAGLDQPQQPRTGVYDRRVRIPPSVAHQYGERMQGLTSPSNHAPIRPTGTDTTIRRTPIRRAHAGLDQPQQPRTDTTDGYGYHHPSHTNTMPGLTSPSNHAPVRTDTADAYDRRVRIPPSVAHQYGERMSGLTSPSKHAPIRPSVAHQYGERMPGLTSPSNHAPIRPTGTDTTIRRTPIRRAHAGLDQPQQARTGAYGFGRCVRVRPSVAHQYDEHMPGLTSPSKHAPVRTVIRL